MSRPRRPGRLRLLLAVVAVALAVPLALVSTGDRPAGAAAFPGFFAWVESVDRGDHYRLVVDDGGGGPRVLAEQVYGRPAFSPDGTQVAYSGPRGDGSLGRYALFVVNLDGSGRRQLTSPRIGDFDPAWAPDGSAIAVSRDERGNFEPSCCALWLIGTQGQGDRRLDAATSARQPAWAPDGGHVAFASPEGVHIMAPSTGASRLVAGGPLSWPSFAPDSRTVAVVRSTGPESGVVARVGFDGGPLTDTASGPGLPEAPVHADQERLLHLSVAGLGEDGRTRGEVRLTTVGGGTETLFGTGRPMYYLAWTPGPQRPAPPPTRTLGFACPPDRVGEDGFTDVPPGNVHEGAVDCLVHWQVANGRSADTYAPADTVSREQMASFIARMVEQSGGTLPEPTQDHFVDDDTSTHQDNINRLTEAGVVSGRSPGRYEPREPVSRAQMAALLTRAYDYRATQDGGEALPPGQDYFFDDETSPLQAAINSAAEAGFTGGTGNSRYRPDGGVRRDQMASFVARSLDLLVERDLAQVP